MTYKVILHQFGFQLFVEYLKTYFYTYSYSIFRGL
jgi:hypothetical protein